MISKAILYLSGFRVEKKDYGILLKYPSWIPEKNRKESADKVKKDLEVATGEKLKITFGSSLVKIEKDNGNDQ